MAKLKPQSGDQAWIKDPDGDGEIYVTISVYPTRFAYYQDGKYYQFPIESLVPADPVGFSTLKFWRYDPTVQVNKKPTRPPTVRTNYDTYSVYFNWYNEPQPRVYRVSSTSPDLAKLKAFNLLAKDLNVSPQSINTHFAGRPNSIEVKLIKP